MILYHLVVGMIIALFINRSIKEEVKALISSTAVQFSVCLILFPEETFANWVSVNFAWGSWMTNIMGVNLQFGGTSLLIIVGVALETVK